MKTQELLKTYNLVKRKYDNAIVLIRNDDTYITFKEDAQCLAGMMETDLKLTDSGIPTCCCELEATKLHYAIQLFAEKSLTVAVCDPVVHEKNVMGE